VRSYAAQFARHGFAGVDVFTNFDAHNDWRNHVHVAEAIHENNAHYQAALSWAVYAAGECCRLWTPRTALTSLKPHTDPTIYNVQWVLDFFREVPMQLQITSIGTQLLGQKDFDLPAIR